ncbi:Apoptosis-stimulating of p53 protein 2 [Eumeta japonica]|uniref:Apoptosis-stimulating of p53 protein 2 n=1 Tax=Eumeta variegata TaxID=151549 RepID=A0A4C1ZNL7_EUMVA|nr:Apoptosis-stimulating of p53 protein 2 [Eumeta japonica]
MPHSPHVPPSDLESIRALFNEKEKELSVAVAKVEELTRQLEELRRGRAPPAPPAPPAAHELDKLRRELMVLSSYTSEALPTFFFLRG